LNQAIWANRSQGAPGGFLRKGRKNVGHGLHNLLRSGFGAMASGKPARLVIGEPGLAGFVLPDKRLERQIDADRLCGLHQRCAGAWIAEDDDLGGSQRHSDLCRSRRVVDAREDRYATACDRGSDAVHRLLWSMAAWADCHSNRCHARSPCRVTANQWLPELSQR
jgi:hypothetical protein